LTVIAARERDLREPPKWPLMTMPQVRIQRQNVRVEGVEVAVEQRASTNAVNRA
jgi:hypothetical protein